MSKANNLTDFLTDIANAIREKKGTSEKINPQNFSTEIANLQSGGGSNSSLSTDVVASKQFPFTLDEQYGSFGIFSCNPVLIGELSTHFVLVENETYKVVWDGTTYECAGLAFNVDGVSGVGIGNAGILGAGANTGEPFVIMYIPNFGPISNHVTFMTPDTSSSHTIHIYQGIDIATVSFYNYDGSLLYQKPTIEGDDCMDIIAKGLLITPTRASDNYNHYAFKGWSLENDNTVDSGVLSAINGDRDIYACYSASTRYYTVRFFDGNTLVETVQVTYGGTAVPTYQKAGYKFIEWDKPIDNITSNLEVFGTWVELSLATDDWEVIAQRSADGTAKDIYKVGDTKTIALTDGTEMTVAIAGFDIHRDTDGNKSGITFIQVSDYIPRPDDAYSWVYNTNNKGSDKIYEQFTDDLKNVVKQSMITLKTYSNSTVSDVTNNVYTFIPEVHNFHKDVPTTVSTSYGTKNVLENEYDATVFPIFDGKTKEEVSIILGFATGTCYITRSLSYHKTQYFSVTYNPAVKDDLSLNDGSGNGKTDRFGIICFRV